jgi:uncharacterized damage-inducible protein DinB
MPEPVINGAAAAGRLQVTTDEIVSEVRSLPAELINWIPGAGVWSVMDILCHIREFVPYWTGQTQRMIGSPADPWGRDHTDTARLAAVTNTAANRLDDVLEDIGREVRQSASTLAALSDADLAVEATSRNPRWGVKPASFVVDHLLLQHVEKHLGQIRRNVRQFRESKSGGETRVSSQ